MAGKASLTTEKPGEIYSSAHPPSHNTEYAINVAQAIQFTVRNKEMQPTEPNLTITNYSHFLATVVTRMRLWVLEC